MESLKGERRERSNLSEFATLLTSARNGSSPKPQPCDYENQALEDSR
jgi:hypothetical protein